MSLLFKLLSLGESSPLDDFFFLRFLVTTSRSGSICGDMMLKFSSVVCTMGVGGTASLSLSELLLSSPPLSSDLGSSAYKFKFRSANSSASSSTSWPFSEKMSSISGGVVVASFSWSSGRKLSSESLTDLGCASSDGEGGGDDVDLGFVALLLLSLRLLAMRMSLFSAGVRGVESTAADSVVSVSVSAAFGASPVSSADWLVGFLLPLARFGFGERGRE